MINVQDLPQNFCMGCYLPQRYWPEEDYSSDFFTEFIRNIKSCDDDAIKQCAQVIRDNLCGFDAVTTAPSGTPGKHSGIKVVAQTLASSKNIVDATLCLVRNKKISSYYEGGIRTIKDHLQSIDVQHPELLHGKNILLLDDVRTTGVSLQACQKVLEQVFPKSIVSIALAQTCRPDACDPIYGFYQDLKNRIEENHLNQYMEITEKYNLEIQRLNYWLEEEHRALQELKIFYRQ